MADTDPFVTMPAEQADAEDPKDRPGRVVKRFKDEDGTPLCVVDTSKGSGKDQRPPRPGGPPSAIEAPSAPSKPKSEPGPEPKQAAPKAKGPGQGKGKGK